MADVYEQSYCHLVWATTKREAMISPDVEKTLYDYIYQKCRDKRAFVYALGGMPDHVHLVCSVPVTMSVSDFMKLVKGSSSHSVNRRSQDTYLRWQRGYAYLTFAKHDLDAVVTYVQEQKKHHAEGGKLWTSIEYLPGED